MAPNKPYLWLNLPNGNIEIMYSSTFPSFSINNWYTDGDKLVVRCFLSGTETNPAQTLEQSFPLTSAYGYNAGVHSRVTISFIINGVLQGSANVRIDSALSS